MLELLVPHGECAQNCHTRLCANCKNNAMAARGRPLLALLLFVLLAAPCFVGSIWRRSHGLAIQAKGSGEPENEAPAMILDEEFRRGETLESEFRRVLEARKRGTDIKRDPGLKEKNEFEVVMRRAQDAASAIDFGNAVTWFWLLLISLIVVAWFFPLLR
eukprot:s4528_g1.t1